MTDKTETLKPTKADEKARDEAVKADEQAQNEAAISDAQKQAELDSHAAEASKAGAKGKTLKGPNGGVILERKAFIGGRLYEAGEEAPENDGDGNYRAVAKSTPIGNASIEELKQALTAAQAAEKAKKAS